ncbi:uncharacterized protein LOC124118994 [Haliotis rufescens]|uniref:uncharacterized protein LOC124118994 n=1 Tax=Haliotis rufescens TaxID=6454 RepID=UPI00201F5218|nr:uncharacterized protein LOC124118994 [Haliotis rufescens]
MAADTENAKLLSPLKLYAAVVLICGVFGLQNVGLRLTSDPMFAKDGASVTISCRDTGGNNITTAQWYRNNVIIFQTSHLLPNQTLDENRNTSVYGRITVDATIRRHDIILPFNTTLDERSVWWCRNGDESSYNMTLCSEHIDECIRPNLTSESKEALDGNNVTLSCRHGAGRNITTVLWYRNYVYIFQTSTHKPEIVQDKQSDKDDYRAVDGRILVNANFAVHNVSLQMNSSLDAESVWTCDNNQKFSDDLVIETKRSEREITPLISGSSESTAFPLSSTPTTYRNAGSSESTAFPLSSTPTTYGNVDSKKTTTTLGITKPTTEEYATTSQPSTRSVTTQTTKDDSSSDKRTSSASTLTTSTFKSNSRFEYAYFTGSRKSTSHQPAVHLTTLSQPVSSSAGTKNEIILYAVIGSAIVVVVMTTVAVTVCLVCVKKMIGRKDTDKHTIDEGTPEGNHGDVNMDVMVDNEAYVQYAYIEDTNSCDVQYEREPAVMVDNVCYHGYSDSDVSDTSYWEYNGPADERAGSDNKE